MGIGCNYWASHAGLFMWRNWRPEVVEADLARLEAGGVQGLRVFPLWPDFQPIHQPRGQNGVPQEIRFGETPLPNDPLGQAGISSEMLARFAQFCTMAEQAGLKLVVGLITGWKNGRLFVPPALEGLNPITDVTSIGWQVRFVTGLFAR
jgi:endo-1,4-beta-mannosidase